MSLAAETAPASEPRCETVYGYVLGFDGPQRSVIGVQDSGQWYLPGGPVEGDDLPDSSQVQVPADCGDPLRFAPLAVHVRRQTGLELVRVVGPFAVNMHPGSGETFDVSMYYLAVARGQRNGGKLLTADDLPQFAPECPAEPAFIRAFLATGNPLARPSWWRRFCHRLRGQQG